MRVVALRRGREWLFDPDGEDVMLPDDVLILRGARGDRRDPRARGRARVAHGHRRGGSGHHRSRPGRRRARRHEERVGGRGRPGLLGPAAARLRAGGPGEPARGPARRDARAARAVGAARGGRDRRPVGAARPAAPRGGVGGGRRRGPAARVAGRGRRGDAPGARRPRSARPTTSWCSIPSRRGARSTARWWAAPRSATTRASICSPSGAAGATCTGRGPHHAHGRRRGPRERTPRRARCARRTVGLQAAPKTKTPER